MLNHMCVLALSSSLSFRFLRLSLQTCLIMLTVYILGQSLVLQVSKDKKRNHNFFGLAPGQRVRACMRVCVQVDSSF